MTTSLTEHVIPTGGALFLRRALLLDAATSGAMALILLAFSGGLASLFGLQASHLMAAGIMFLPFALAVGFLGTRSAPPAAAAWAVIALNAAYVVGCIALLVLGVIAPNTLGTVFVVAQAIVVAVLAELEFIGLKRMALA